MKSLTLPGKELDPTEIWEVTVPDTHTYTLCPDLVGTGRADLSQKGYAQRASRGRKIFKARKIKPSLLFSFDYRL